MRLKEHTHTHTQRPHPPPHPLTSSCSFSMDDTSRFLSFMAALSSVPAARIADTVSAVSLTDCSAKVVLSMLACWLYSWSRWPSYIFFCLRTCAGSVCGVCVGVGRGGGKKRPEIETRARPLSPPPLSPLLSSSSLTCSARRLAASWAGPGRARRICSRSGMSCASNFLIFSSRLGGCGGGGWGGVRVCESLGGRSGRERREGAAERASKTHGIPPPLLPRSRVAARVQPLGRFLQGDTLGGRLLGAEYAAHGVGARREKGKNRVGQQTHNAVE